MAWLAGCAAAGAQAPVVSPPFAPVLRLPPLGTVLPTQPPVAEAENVTATPLTDLDDGPEVIERADRLLGRGQIDEALALVASRPADDPVAVVVRARVDRRRGSEAAAVGALAAAAQADPLGEAALELGLLEYRRGDREGAKAVLTPIVEAATELGTAPALFRAALAARVLGDSRLANGLFREAAGGAAGSPRLETAWGELLHDAHNDPDAIKSFERALEVEADYAPAHVGMALALAELNPPAAETSAKKALEIDSGNVGAHLILAELALDSRRAADAREHIDAALAANPSSIGALALRAALAAIEGTPDAFGAAVAAALAINPRDADIYRIPSVLVAAHYRFEEAVDLARKAVELDPEDAKARAALGLHLMRTGDEASARAHLEAAFSRDPFNEVTYNLLGLLDKLEGFETVRDGDLVFRFHPDEAAILRELAPPLARDAMAALSKRYGFTPAGPILVELFPQHDDFAVRTLGLPGMLGALGACFGKVVTLDSPRARPPGAFHWGATLWHELAHVFTLQMSRQRVPRWLTEGISVFEERQARGQWGRESELAFVRSLDRPGAIPLATLNDGFQDPRRIALAYQQASLLVEFLVGHYGNEALHRLLRAYGDGLDDDAATTLALGSTLAGLQGPFDAFIAERYGAIREAMRVPEGVSADGLDIAGLVALADANPRSFPIQMAAGEAAAESGDHTAARRLFERAAALVPIATGDDGPRVLLARAALAAGDRQRALAELETAVAESGEGLAAARELAELAAKAGDAARTERAHERISELVPHESASHSALGRVALARGDVVDATRRFRLALAAQPDDVVAARTDHAEALAAGGQTSEARREVLSALEDAPLYERAQNLLLQIVDLDRRGVRQR